MSLSYREKKFSTKCTMTCIFKRSAMCSKMQIIGNDHWSQKVKIPKIILFDFLVLNIDET